MTETPDQEIRVCKDCEKDYTLTAGEVEFYRGVIARVPTFQMPKRCPTCRAIKKKQRAMERQNNSSIPDTPKRTFEEFDKELGI